MVSKSLALLALSSLAIAKPHGHQHQHVPKHMPQGTGPRGPRGTGGPGGMFPGHNGTWGDAPFPAGSGGGSIPVVTQTVVPVPGGDAPSVPTGAPQVPSGGQGGAAPPAGGASGGGQGAAPPKPQVPSGGEGAAAPPAGGASGGGQGGISGPPDVNNNIPSTDVAGGHAGAGGAGGNACVPQTTTTTTIQYVTVTAGAGSPPQGAAPPAGGAPSAGGQADLTNTKDASAGQFFGVPTGGFGGGYGGGHGGQGGQGGEGGAAQPTTFATQPAGGYGAPTASGSLPVPTGGSGSGSGSGSGNSTGGGAAAGGKAGLSYNSAGLLSAFDGTGMSWAYNWAAKPDGTLPSGVEYVPMCWGANDIDTCGQAAAGAKHVLSFNEPDLAEQAGMTAEAAAAGHIKALNPLAAQGAQIGSPAITNGGAPMGTAYLQSFFDACNGQCKVDFVTFHWYDSASNFAYFKQHVEDVIAVAQKNGVSKVWCTEFGVTSGDAASFITEAKAFLDSTPAVERYAYFMAAEGNLIQGGGLSAAGKAYAGQS